MRVHLELSSYREFKENIYVASILAVPVRPVGSAERYFQWSLYLLLVTGFAALAGTGKLDFLSLAVVAPALLLRGYHLVKGKNFALAERWTNYLTIVYFVVYGLDYFMLSQGFVSATVHLVLFIMVVKIFSVQRDRDLLYLSVLSFLMVLAAAVLTVDTLFLLTFGFFLLMAMSTFISMEMRRSERAAQAVGVATQQGRKFNRSLSGVAVLLTLATLAGATILFFILPRMSTGGGYLRNFGFQSNFVTGFSSEVQLGGIGQIQQSNSVVMHVQVLHGKLPPDTKWRGVALVNFDGRRWWFFAGMHEPAGHVATSMLFSADSLTGDWTPHPANPIAADVRTARNAGAIFSSGGRLFRPSQDCAGGYGRSVSFNEIATLNREEYAERAVLRVVPEPSWDCSGAHTYNFSGRFEAIDAVRSEPRAAHL